MSNQFGAVLASLRKAQGLTQKALAKTSGVSRAAIADLERGHYSSPRIATLRRLAKALKVQAAALLVEEPRRSRHSTPRR